MFLPNRPNKSQNTSSGNLKNAIFPFSEMLPQADVCQKALQLLLESTATHGERPNRKTRPKNVKAETNVYLNLKLRERNASLKKRIIYPTSEHFGGRMISAQ